jgi:hypothetical protein
MRRTRPTATPVAAIGTRDQRNCGATGANANERLRWGARDWTLSAATHRLLPSQLEIVAFALPE